MWRWCVLLAGCANEAEPTVAIEVDAPSGRIPFEATFTAIGDPPATEVTWALDDGTTLDGEVVSHTFLAAGDQTVTATWTTADGSATATASVEVKAQRCPDTGASTATGEVLDDALAEISGVAASRKSPGILWIHEDSGNEAEVYATDERGAILGVFALEDEDDLEDIAVGRDPETGEDRLYVGDIGDNDYKTDPREDIAVYIAPEPSVTPGAEEAVVGVLDVTTVVLEYPDGAKNAEVLLVDPVTDDLYVVTKVLNGLTEVYRKAAPHVDDEVATLELVATLDLPGPVTGGDISPLGNALMIRDYTTTATVWLRDGADSVAKALRADGCAITLPVEPQSESAAFAPDGAGIWTISERQPVVWFTPLTD